MSMIANVSPINFNNVRAVPVTDLVQGKTKVVEWTIWKSGSQVARIPDSLFQQEKDDILNAYSEGKPWVPSTSMPSRVIDGRAMTHRTVQNMLPAVCVDGHDLTYEVNEHVRFLLGRELSRDGQFTEACKAIASEQWGGFVRELFARVIGDLNPLDPSALGTEWIKVIHDKVEEIPEWDSLRKLGEGDEWCAGIGASIVARKLADKFSTALEQLPAEDPQKLSANVEAVREIAGDRKGAKREIAKAQAQVDQAVTAADACAVALSASDTLGNTIQAAVREATAEVSQTLAAMSALGCGGEPGHASVVTGPRGELVEAFRKDDKLRRVAALAGRLRVAARAAQKAKVRYLPEQIANVTLGGEVARLLPSELALLAIEETELAELRRIVEREALQYEMIGRESLDRGPLILCVDESGSMRGDRHELAMAVGLALIEIAALQNRPFALVRFAQQVSNTWLVEKPREVPIDALAKQVALFSGGGTDFEPPLRRSGELIRSANVMREADVILLTDGAAGWKDGPRELNALGARLWGVEIGGQFTAAQKKEMAGVATLNVDLSGSVEKLDLVLGV